MPDDKIWDPRNLAHGEEFSLPKGEGDETDDYAMECWTELDGAIYFFAFDAAGAHSTKGRPYVFHYSVEDGVPYTDDVEDTELHETLYAFWETWVKNSGAVTGDYPIHRATDDETVYYVTIEGETRPVVALIIGFPHDLRTYAMFMETATFGDRGFTFTRMHLYEYWKEDDVEHYAGVPIEDMPDVLRTAGAIVDTYQENEAASETAC